MCSVEVSLCFVDNCSAAWTVVELHLGLERFAYEDLTVELNAVVVADVVAAVVVSVVVAVVAVVAVVVEVVDGIVVGVVAVDGISAVAAAAELYIWAGVCRSVEQMAGCLEGTVWPGSYLDKAQKRKLVLFAQ